MTATPDTLAWQALAACRDADIADFFGPDHESADARAAREARALRVCASCLVTVDCLGYALERRPQFGVWGGAGEAERAAYRENMMQRARAGRRRAA